MTRRLLAISWDMPPLSGPRAVQVSRLLAHLAPLGWESTVVCVGARSPRYNQDDELAGRLKSDAVRLVHVPSREERLLFRALWRIVPPVKLLPDEKWVWIGPAARAARRLAQGGRFDRLVSFAQPWSDHLIGLRVHRATGLPWVAHFSDPWTDSPYLSGRGWQRALWRRMEADVVREAAAVVFVNAQTAERVMSKYPADWRRKMHVVPHGFDPDGGPAAAPALDGRARFVYTGRFYDGLRSPEALLRALAALNGRRVLAREMHVAFVGPPIEKYVRLASALKLDGVVEFTGRVTAAESARRAAGADVLLVIDAPSDDSLFLPSKLVEYLSFAKPILGLTPDRGASADLLRALGYAVMPPDDDARIAAAVESILDAKRAGGLRVSDRHGDVARQYDIRRIAPQFADILTRCA